MTDPGSDERYIGASVPRLHDGRLVRGGGRYVDDIDTGGALHAAILRSPIAHGRIRSFSGEAAVRAGAALVLGPADIAGLAGSLPTTWRLPGQQLDRVQVGGDIVRYVGQPIGIVVAGSRALAEDAAELVEVDYEQWPAVIGTAAATRPDAPLLYPATGSNVAGSMHFGDPVEVLASACQDAPHVIERSFSIQRIAHSPMETRGVLAEWIPTTEQLTVWTSSQSPHAVRQDLADCMGLRIDQIRVVAPDVGGAFGGKTVLHVDETMVCLAARRLGRAVSWVEDRHENLISSYQGRGQEVRARLALDADGHFLALHAEIDGDLGAFCSQAGSGPFQVAGLSIEGPYRFAAAGASVRCVYTNAVPTASYRGYGMQESAWVRERLIDEAARALGHDPVALRQLNLVRPADLPHTTHTFLTYDSGDYPAALAGVAELATAGESTDRIRRGVGFACSVEVTGFAPSAMLKMFGIDWSGWESGRIRVNEDGSVTVTSGVIAVGQGIETALAQIVADQLGVPLDWVRVALGDTATSTHSDLSSQASRSVTLAGGALMQAGDRMRERMHALAAAALAAAPEDVRWDGKCFVAASLGTTISWTEVARYGWKGWGPAPEGRIQLEETVDFDPPGITYSYSSHAAAVSVDLDTGLVTVDGYWCVNDSGVLVNPMLVDGQIAGGIGQGIGMALLEEVRYDQDSGQPMTTSLFDYRLPVSSSVPKVVIEHRCTPSALIPGGFKGLGESGIIPSPAAIGNAVAAAVPEIADQLTATPLSAERLWKAMDDAGLTRS